MMTVGFAMTAGAFARVPSRLLAVKRDRECGRARRAAGSLLDSACGLAAGSLLVRLLETNAQAREALPWWYLTTKRRRYSQPGFRPSRTRD